MLFYKCTKCKQYSFHPEECDCVLFKVIDEDGDTSDWYGINEEAVALLYAEETNINNDYYLMNEEVTIQVGGKKFVIGAEPDVYYHANEVKEGG